MEEWIFSCCGGTLFVLVPFVGYTRIEEVFGLTVILLVIPGLLYLLMRRLGHWAKLLMVATLSVSVEALYGSDYVQYALSSLSASVIHEHSIMQGRMFFMDTDNKEMDGIGLVRPTTIRVLTEDEASEVVKHLESKKEKFMHINHLAYALPFFTYGPYWGYHEFGEMFNHISNKARPKRKYRLSSTLTTYEDALNLTRDEMMSELGWLYDKVFWGLGEALNTDDVNFLPGNVGLPGFHIIPSHLAWTFPIFRFHSDELFDLIVNYVIKDKGVKGLDPETCAAESRISFTLPIDLPDANSGLNFVDFSVDDSGADCKNEAERKYGSAAWRCHKKTREKYEVGKMVIHAGQLLHSIGEWNYAGYSANRITMQG
eukprot:CAMPEP_0118637600 /NCGR_PEP_ID=MMETSP0785-20121206/3236_1 /TAXON_ID=91992 /ORGANISM="Bolidomonas pacifica, Strain CCMP 1866" /LENGTH=370 /DNA_ID=CAMNT_0006528791 /DNA_START=118 /DNA_END=1226 /DNA_ORIENTATION=-